MQLATGYENRKPRIEIVPLIDVVFLLLVFFIYAMLSMVVCRGLRVELPSAQGVTEDMKTVIITLSSDNGVSIINSTPLTLQALSKICLPMNSDRQFHNVLQYL